MSEFIAKITPFCFGASYAVALAFELLHLFRRRPFHRLIALGWGVAGLVAQTLFLAFQRPSLASQFGCLIFLSWVLAIFYLYGSVHHYRQVWGVFVLPVVVLLNGIAALFGPPTEGQSSWLRGLGILHGSLLLLAAVGVCVGFVASVMYLFQSHRLKAKLPPGRGLRLPSLERLEGMHRRAIAWSFPLLTAGLIVGLGLMTHQLGSLEGWFDPRVTGFLLLWLVFAILLYLRYGIRLPGRHVAVLTIAAFALLVFTLAAPHTFGQGARP